MTSEGAPENTVPRDQVVRLSINLAPDVAATLKAIAESRSASVTETVRRAIAVLKFVEDEVARGNRLIIVDDGGCERQVVLLT